MGEDGWLERFIEAISCIIYTNVTTSFAGAQSWCSAISPVHGANVDGYIMLQYSETTFLLHAKIGLSAEASTVYQNPRISPARNLK